MLSEVVVMLYTVYYIYIPYSTIINNCTTTAHVLKALVYSYLTFAVHINGPGLKKKRNLISVHMNGHRHSVRGNCFEKFIINS